MLRRERAGINPPPRSQTWRITGPSGSDCLAPGRMGLHGTDGSSSSMKKRREQPGYIQRPARPSSADTAKHQ
ncbi:hypothetical protein chiPu_0031974, partial [Chiloscyllium punctatum]|nr:hypothetical protein [Chiloscyllium punctatum]